jgi:glucose/arabinose dehydrogenase
MMWSLSCLTLSLADPAGWVVETVPAPLGEVVEVGGIAFPEEGTIAVSTRRGRVWLIDGALDNDPSDATWNIFADGLYEGLGLDTAGDDLMVLQRGELSLLRDVDGDRRVDDIEVITADWGLSDNYHEFAFGLPRDAEGNRYVSFNLGFMEPDWWHGKAVVPNRGSIMQVSPSGELTPWAHGFRSPCGLGFDATGRLLATDNQGDWMPSSPIFVVQKDGFHDIPRACVGPMPTARAIGCLMTKCPLVLIAFRRQFGFLMTGHDRLATSWPTQPAAHLGRLQISSLCLS